MRVLGMISGTSHDGIDVAVVDFTIDGGTLAGRIEHSDSVPYDPQLRSRIIAALPPARPGFEAACELDTSIGQAFAAVAADVLTALGPDRPDLICSHGQTVFHWVVDGHARGTLQLGQPAWIAEATGVPVLSDVRAADVAAGGEGAPLVSILDRMLLEPYRAAGVRAGALNLGGISNITVCAPDSEPTAWDIGTANALIDAVVTADPATCGHLRPRRRPGRVGHRGPGAADRAAGRALLPAAAAQELGQGAVPPRLRAPGDRPGRGRPSVSPTWWPRWPSWRP